MSWLTEIRWDFFAAYCAIVGVGLLLRSAPIIRVSAALLFSWAIGTWFVLMTENYSPWPLSAALDFAVACVVLRDPAGRWQSAIGWTLIAQIVIHFVFGVMQIRGQQPDEMAYWQVLTALAWVQIALIGIWGIGGGYRALHRRLRHRPHLRLSSGMGGLEP